MPSVSPNLIAIAGMGGSGVGGEVLSDLLANELEIPVINIHDYALPACVRQDSLVFAVSYSGDTEETISSFADAVERGCFVVGISSGGCLEKLCKRLGRLHAKLPAGIPPRAAFPYLFLTLLRALEKAGLVDKRAELDEAIPALEDARDSLRPEIPMERNEAKRIASKIFGKIPFVYGFGPYQGAAIRLKNQLEENAKTVAKCQVLPELNHNEVVGWERFEFGSHVALIFLRDSEEESSPIRARIEATKELLAGKVGCVEEMRGRGRFRLTRLLTCIYLGDFVSYYLSILREVEPTLTESITRLKERLRAVDVIGGTLRRLGLA